MKKLALFIACALFAVPAFGQSTSFPREVRGYNDIFVTLSPKVARCNIKEPGVFKARLRDKLGAIGIKQNPESRVFPFLSIAGDKFGVMGALCNFSVQLDWRASLMANEIKARDPNIRAAIDRMGAVPVILYQETAFGVATLTGPTNPDAGGKTDDVRSMAAQNKALELVDALVAHFEEQRRK